MMKEAQVDTDKWLAKLRAKPKVTKSGSRNGGRHAFVLDDPATRKAFERWWTDPEYLLKDAAKDLGVSSACAHGRFKHIRQAMQNGQAKP